MKNKEELIWKYLDGTCSPEEIVALETYMEEDPVMKAMVLERKQLNTTLQAIEAEQPSLRFAKNIMDKLPKLYQRTIEPLVRPFWIKTFFGILGLTLIGYTGLVIYSLQNEQTLVPDSPVSTLTNQFTSLFSGLPYQVLSVLASFSIAYLFLVVLDRKLKNQVTGRKKV